MTLCLFRVAQEALQNIIKHSGASQVAIRLIGTETELLLTIVDDGMGFDGETEQHTGLGLVSMRERLDAIGGLLKDLDEARCGHSPRDFRPSRARDERSSTPSVTASRHTLTVAGCRSRGCVPVVQRVHEISAFRRQAYCAVLLRAGDCA